MVTLNVLEKLMSSLFYPELLYAPPIYVKSIKSFSVFRRSVGRRGRKIRNVLLHTLTLQTNMALGKVKAQASSVSTSAIAVELCSLGDGAADPKHDVFTDSNRSELWGWVCFKPRWLQCLNNPKCFLFFLMLFAVFQGMSINTFVNTSIHSIEKQFSLNSKQTGFIAASNEITSLLFVPFVSFYGGYSHKARVLGYGGLVTGLGCLIFSLPRFLIGPYDPTGGTVGKSGFCSPNGTTDATYLQCHHSETPTEVYLFIFVLSQLVAGAGACPLFTLGPAFLDENVRPKFVPIYLGFFYSCIMLGPGVGATIAGKFLSVYVDLKQPSGVSLTERDPRWLGAWWLGDLTGGIVLLLVGLILLGYPRELPGARAIREEAIRDGVLPTADKRFKGRLRDIVPATKSLLANATYMFQNMALSVSSLMGVGIAPFFFKMMQGKYGGSAFVTGLALSFLTAVGGCGGFSLGSLVVKRLGLKDSCKKAAKWTFLLQFVGIIILFAFLVPGCENTQIVGVHVPYYNSTLQKESLSSACNSKCSCGQSTFNPVCGPGNAIYFSPCFAGCANALPGRRFGNCSCVLPDGNLSSRTYVTGGELTQGMCDRKCKNVFVFAISCAVGIIFAFSNAVPSKIVTLRAVADNQRPLALGLQFVFQRAIGMLPGPIIFGHLVDSTCQVWRVKCGKRSSCADHDYDKLSIYIIAVGAPMLSLSILFYFLSWHFSKQMTGKIQVPLNSDTEEKQTNKSPSGEKCVADEPAEGTVDICKSEVSVLRNENLNFEQDISTNEMNINRGFTAETESDTVPMLKKELYTDAQVLDNNKQDIAEGNENPGYAQDSETEPVGTVNSKVSADTLLLLARIKKEQDVANEGGNGVHDSGSESAGMPNMEVPAETQALQ